jgi:hypothetical protein
MGMESWPKDTTAAKNAFYGDFHAAIWQGKFLTGITPPFQMYYAKQPMPSILVNRICSAAFLSVFNEIWNACGHDQKGQFTLVTLATIAPPFSAILDRWRARRCRR